MGINTNPVAVPNELGLWGFIENFIAKVFGAPVEIFAPLSWWGFIEKCMAKVFGAPVEILTPFSWKGLKSLRETFAETEGLKLWRMFFLVVFQFIVLAIQVPLLVLAVRRRFKR